VPSAVGSVCQAVWGMAIVLGLSCLGTGAAPARAAQFEQQIVNAEDFVVIAAPIGRTGRHQLLILEQVSNQRLCWREYGQQPVRVDPLLLNFDFTGICDRKTDSNGFSIRMAGRDLGLYYTLRIVQRQGQLVLVGTPNSLRGPEIEIARSQGLADEFVKLTLDPGWQLTRRAYRGQPVGHVYLTRDQAVPQVMASLPASLQASVGSPTLPRLGSRPAALRPGVPVRPPVSADRGTISVPQPGRPIEIPVPPPQSSNIPPVSNPLGTIPVPAPAPPGYTGDAGLPNITVLQQPQPIGDGSPPPPPVNLAASLGYRYRLVVYTRNEAEQLQVRSLIPDAFRVRVNGRLVMQAGLFETQDEAILVEQTLQRNGLVTEILPVR